MTDQDRHDAETKESSFSRLPNYPNNPFVISEIPCQECEEIRPGTKCYPVLHMVFLFAGAAARIDHVVKCPTCMRRFLIQRILLSLLLANVLAPIVLVWWGVLFIRTLSGRND